MAEDFKIVAELSGYEITRSMNSVTGEEDQWLELEGLAIDDTIDQKAGHFDSGCIFEMIDTVNAGASTPVFENEKVMRAMVAAGAPAPVGVDSEHSHFWNHQMGYLTKAWAETGPNGETQMKVRLKLDLGLSTVKDLKRSLDKGVKLGLSIYGAVGKMFKEIHRSSGAVIERYKQVHLKRIAITASPVNAHTWVTTVRRSMAPEDIEEMEITDEEVTQPENTTPAEETAPGSRLFDLLMQVRSEVERSLGKEQMDEFDHLVDQALRNPDGNATNETTEESLGEQATEDVARSVGTDEATTDVIEETAKDEEADGLSNAALRQLGGMVPPAVPEVERSLEVSETQEEAVTPAVEEVEEEAPAEVVEAPADTGVVTRSMLDDTMAVIQRALSPLPDFIQRTNAALTELATQVVDLQKDKATLAEEVLRLSNTRNGRAGLSVLRALGNEADEAPEVKPLWGDLPASERSARLRQMKEAGLEKEATMIMMGLVPDPSTLSDEARRHINGG